MEKIEIQTFIKDAITEIFKGVESARPSLEKKEKGKIIGAINPHFADDGNHAQKELIRDINFDIAINFESSSEKAAEAKAKIYVVNVGGWFKKNNKAGQLNKVQFSVPILFPKTIIEGIK